MRLQTKLVLYNLFIKTGIIIILASLILIFQHKISISQLKYRITDKREKLFKNLSQREISELLKAEETFTDYNILKEEYIILNRCSLNDHEKTRTENFIIENRQIEGDDTEYLILIDFFYYKGECYRLEIGETMATADKMEQTIFFFTILILVITVLLTLITDLAFTRYLLSPFYQIIEQKLNAIVDPMSFTPTKIKTSTKDFKLLDDSINGFMAKINYQFLIEKQFISNLSHEILTPISILKNRLENMLSDENIPDGSQAKIVSSLKTLNRLKSMINSLLLISKIENNQYNKTDLIRIDETVAEVLEELEDRIESNQIVIRQGFHHQQMVAVNKALIHILFMNVINNAIKYNVPSGSVSISDELTDEFYLIIIKDTGKGMSEHQIEKAFNRFEKLDSRQNDSHGLGLAIVKSIATFHAITLQVSSETGKGTVISLKFPIQS